LITIDRHIEIFGLARPLNIAYTDFEMAVAVIVINHQLLGAADIMQRDLLSCRIACICLSRVDTLTDLLDVLVLAQYWNELLRFPQLRLRNRMQGSNVQFL
jgi:hypothetical protein